MVYLAEHVTLGRRAALKLLLPEFARDAALAARVVREARAANRIAHPSVVQIFEIDQTESGCPYLVMEYLAGETLAVRLQRPKAAPTGTVDASALVAVRQIAAALAEFHRQGLIHRDLKPGNIMLVPDPEVPGGERAKLLDFGIAKILASSAPDDPAGTDSTGPEIDLRTQTGMLLGTPQYMAPEQWRNGEALDGQVDVYALGVICFQILSGRLPFSARDPMALGMQHLLELAPTLSHQDPTILPELSALVSAMMAKQPTDRPDMDMVVKRLGSILSALSLGVTSGLGRLAPVKEAVQPPEPTHQSKDAPPAQSTAPSPTVPSTLFALPAPIALAKKAEESSPTDLPSAASVGGVELQSAANAALQTTRSRSSRWALGAVLAGTVLGSALLVDRWVHPEPPLPAQAPAAAKRNAILPTVPTSSVSATGPEATNTALPQATAGRSTVGSVDSAADSQPASGAKETRKIAGQPHPLIAAPAASQPRVSTCETRTLPDATCVLGGALDERQREALLKAFKLTDARLCPGERVVIAAINGEGRVLDPLPSSRFPKQHMEDTLRTLFGPPPNPPLPSKMRVQCSAR